MSNSDKIERLSERMDKLEEENRRLKRDALSQSEGSGNNEEQGKSSKMSRRGFMKMLGIGAGGLALSSTAAGLNWSVVQPSNDGTSDVEAKTATEGSAPFTLQGNLEAKDGEVLWDENNTFIPNSALEGILAEEKGSGVVNFNKINFATGSYVLDDGDGSVSVNSFDRRDPRM